MNKDGFLTRDPLDPLSRFDHKQPAVLLDWNSSTRSCANLNDHDESYAIEAQMFFPQMYRSMIDCQPFVNEKLAVLKSKYDALPLERQTPELMIMILNMEEKDDILKAQAYAFTWTFYSKASQDHIRSKKKSELEVANLANDIGALRLLARSTHSQNLVRSEVNYLAAQMKLYELRQNMLHVSGYNRIYENAIKNFKACMTTAEVATFDSCSKKKQRYIITLNVILYFKRFRRN